MIARIAQEILHQLSMMRTAVGMLAVVAFCSMLGTWIVQGLPLQDYVAQYGVWWGQAVWYAGLGDVYRAPWFLGILGILVGSVCVCLWRNGRYIWAQMLGLKVLPSLRQAPAVEVDAARLKGHGFWYLGEVDGYGVWERGRLNRVGYFLVHGGVVGIAIAGLMSGFLGWRGNLNLREGEADKVVLVWKGAEAAPRFLPFEVRNEGFDITFYDSGMPKGYATDLHFEGGAHGREGVQRVEVNKPLSVGGYTFYQASFGDGGSAMKGEGVNLRTGQVVPFDGKVYEQARLADGTRVELLDARLNTVETVTGQAPTDAGASVDYLVQPPDAPARQLRAYQNLPDVVGVADGTAMRGGEEAVVYQPMDMAGYAEVLRLVKGDGDAVRDDAVRAAIAERVEHLEGDAKMAEALRLWQVHRLVQELDLRYVLRLEDFTLTRYSGLMVAYDPGVWLFWPAGFLATLGVVLMMGRRLVRVFVKDGKGYVTSPHGMRIVGDVVGELESK